MVKEKLQIALVLPDVAVPDWMVTTIDTIVRSDHSEIAVLFIPTSKMVHQLLPSGNSFKHHLYRKYVQSDKVKYRLSPDALKKIHLKDVFDLPISEVAITQKAQKYHLGQIATTKVTVDNIAVLISLLDGDFPLVLPQQMNCAVWNIQQAGQIERRGPVGVWEFLKGKEVTGVALSAYLGGHKENLVISESFSSTDKFGMHRNLNNYLWKVPFMIARELKRLGQMGIETYYKKARNTTTLPLPSKQDFRYPNNLDMILGLGRNYLKRFRKKIDRKLNFEQYILLFKMGSAATITQDFSKFERIIPPKDRFWADPFVIQKDKRHYIFIEELIYKNKLGTIGVIEMDDDGTYSAPKMVLEKDYHLSYPFLIETNDELYMIPESNADNTIQLYKCLDFPLRWELEETLMKDIQALDTTVYFHNNRYWMFTNMKEHPGISGYDELFLFHSDRLVGGNWIPHPQNPIVSDVRSARPAGGIFVKDEKLYRPAQNCAKRYGYGMQLTEIKTLTETEYHEEIVQSIYPDWANDLRTTHTINHKGDLTVIDALIGRRK